VARTERDEGRRTSWAADGAAVVYDRSRPGYAPAGLDFALLPLAGLAAPRVLDLAAGTGQVTRLLLARGLDVVAVDPAPGMRKVLEHNARAARVLAGSAEEIPLPDGAVDLVTVGQAFHWFDLERALPELARVLRPGGVLALLYNSRDDSVAWVRALSDLVGDPERADHVSTTRELDPYELDPLFEFDGVLETPFEQELDTATLVDLIASRSYVITRSPPERAALLEQVAELARTHPQLVGRQHFSMPYVTKVQRYRLRS
jgi:SAM-dependent methyltransferase